MKYLSLALGMARRTLPSRFLSFISAPEFGVLFCLISMLLLPSAAFAVEASQMDMEAVLLDEEPKPVPIPTEIPEEEESSPVYFPMLYNVLFFSPPTTPETVLACSSLASPLPIPDNDPNGVRHTMSHSEPRILHDLNLYLNIKHPWIGDLEISLLHEETGTQIKLLDRPGYPSSQNGCSGDNIITILDDEASQPVEAKCASSIPSISGSFQPEQVLKPLNGLPLDGSWTLILVDHQKADSGSLEGWCMEASVSPHPPAPPNPPEPPVLPLSARIYNISGENQALPLDCESRSAVDWAAYFGTSIGEMDFFNRLPKTDDPDTGFVGNVFGAWGQIPPNPYGVHAAPVAELLRAHGVEAYPHRGISWDVVRSEVAAGRPVIVWVIGSSNGVLPGRFYPVYYTSSAGNTTVVSPYQHTAIVIGYTETQVTLLDGNKIYNRTLTQFLDSWSVLRNMAVMAVP
jgi:subtilisin-like proprotein convertase family protein/uncharacterized protein YvpB